MNRFILSETERERRKRKRQRGQELSTLERRVTLSEKQRGNCVFLDDDRNRTLKQSNSNDQMVLIFDPQENSFRTC